MYIRAIALCLTLALTIQVGQTQSYVPSTITIEYLPGLSYTDGVPFDESEIERYDLYCDGAHVRPVPNDFTRRLTLTVDDLGPGTHTCGLSETVGGIESVVSDTMSFSLGQRTPSAPTLTAVVPGA